MQWSGNNAHRLNVKEDAMVSATLSSLCLTFTCWRVIRNVDQISTLCDASYLYLYLYTPFCPVITTITCALLLAVLMGGQIKR